MGALLTMAGLFYALFVARSAFMLEGERVFTLVDDAMISMRYGQHLAQGHGLVWNIGEAPVEGFTNPGWTLWMAALHLLPASASTRSLLVMASSALCLLLTSYVVFQLCRRIDPTLPIAAQIAAIVTAFYFPLVFWSLRGMEVGAITLLIATSALLAITLEQRFSWRSALLLAVSLLLALIIRLDSALQAGLILLYLATCGSIRQRPLRLLPPVLAVMGGIAAIIALQASYFGDPLPNTYYLKVVGVSLAERAALGVAVLVEYASRDVLLPLVLAGFGVLRWRQMRSRKHALLFGLFLVQCLYSVYAGGDYAEPYGQAPLVDAANRYITQGMPFLIMLCSFALGYLVADLAQLNQPTLRANGALAVGLTLAVLLVISGEPWLKWAAHNAPLLPSDIARARLGVLIKRNTDPQATIAVHAAGQIAYYAERRSIDLLGKSDPVVAKGPPAGPFRPGHNKWNYAYSIGQLRPDVVADEWGELPAFLATQPEYVRLPNGMYVRAGSRLIDREGLERE